MKPARIFLFSGMGGDARLFEKLDLEPLRLIAPDHRDPLPRESLAAYAARIADEHAIDSGDVVGGASFGGMVAAQISRGRDVAGLVLLGTTLRPGKLPLAYRWMFRLEPILPDVVLDLRRWRPLVRWRFSSPTPEAEACIRAMSSSCPRSRLRAFGRMIASWEGTAPPSCPILSVHGARDRMIPFDCAEPSRILETAGHAFTLTHPQETSDLILGFAAGLTPLRGTVRTTPPALP